MHAVCEEQVWHAVPVAQVATAKHAPPPASVLHTFFLSTPFAR